LPREDVPTGSIRQASQGTFPGRSQDERVC
jgi:hypothetical protein